MYASQFAARVLVVATAFAVAGCSNPTEPIDLPDLPWERTAFPELPVPSDNPQTGAKVELGRMLFYDPILSGDGTVACATCHSELWGLSDGLAVSVGVEGVGPTGPGRDGPHKTTRNSQTLWNVAFRNALFWDGRSETLEEQALLPIENEVEMRRELDALIADLRAVDGYRALFADAFDTPDEVVTRENLARALAAFQRTFVSKLAPYDRYARGDFGALNDDAIRGMWLFGEVGCATCHTPPLFQSMGYADRGVGDVDVGRYEVTGDPADQFAFRVPTLRNLRESGPYFHDGSVATLEEAVVHEAERTMDQQGIAMTAEEVAQIAVFIRKGLMDRSLEPDRPEEVPSGLEVPRDGSRIPR